MKNTRFAVFAVTLVVGLSGNFFVNGSPFVERHARSIWPFGGVSSSPEVTTTSSEEPSVAGYDKAIDTAFLQIKPDDRRIWKIHKYQGFDLRPIDLVPEDHTGNSFNHGTISGDSNNQDLPLYPPLNQNQQNLPYSNNQELFGNQETGYQSYPNYQKPSESHQGYPANYQVSTSGGYSSGIPDAAGNPLYSPSSISNNEETTEPVDLSFLDDLGGLAYFLPEPEEAVNVNQGNHYDVGNAPIAIVEETNPGFLQSLLHKLTFGILGSPVKEVKGAAESLGHQEVSSAGFVDSTNSFDVPTYHLPETQGSYIAYRLPANHPAGVHGSSISSQENVYSRDTQSTPYLYNKPVGVLPDSESASFSFADSTGSGESKDNTLINPRGYQNGRPINAFVEGTVDQVPHNTPAIEFGASGGKLLPQNSPVLHYGPRPANSAPQNLPALNYGPPASNSAPLKSPATNSAPQISPALHYGPPATNSAPQKSPALHYGPPPANSAPQNLPALNYGPPASNSAPQKTPALHYGPPPANSAPQNLPALNYGPPASNSAPLKSPALHYGPPASNSAPQHSPALEYGAPTASSAPQKSPALHYGPPAGNSAPQQSPALEYGVPPENSAPQKSPTLEYGAPAENSASQNSPTLEYGAPAENPAPQNSPNLEYGAPTENSAPQKSTDQRYGAPDANSAPQNSPSEDADRLPHPSEYSSVNLSPPLPYRNPVDFGKYSKHSERRVSENEETEDAELAQETEEMDNSNHKPETTTSQIFVVTPDAENARTYSRIRSYST